MLPATLHPGTEPNRNIMDAGQYFWYRFVGLKGIELLSEVNP